jgi:hypothetical protein
VQAHGNKKLCPHKERRQVRCFVGKKKLSAKFARGRSIDRDVSSVKGNENGEQSLFSAKYSQGSDQDLSAVFGMPSTFEANADIRLILRYIYAF